MHEILINGLQRSDIAENSQRKVLKILRGLDNFWMYHYLI